MGFFYDSKIRFKGAANYRQRCSGYFTRLSFRQRTRSLAPQLDAIIAAKKKSTLYGRCFFKVRSTVHIFTCEKRNQIPQSSCHGLQKRVQRVGHNKPPLQDTKVHPPPKRIPEEMDLLSHERDSSLFYPEIVDLFYYFSCKCLVYLYLLITNNKRRILQIH